MTTQSNDEPARNDASRHESLLAIFGSSQLADIQLGLRHRRAATLRRLLRRSLSVLKPAPALRTSTVLATELGSRSDRGG